MVANCFSAHEPERGGVAFKEMGLSPELRLQTRPVVLLKGGYGRLRGGTLPGNSALPTCGCQRVGCEKRWRPRTATLGPGPSCSPGAPCPSREPLPGPRLLNHQQCHPGRSLSLPLTRQRVGASRAVGACPNRPVQQNTQQTDVEQFTHKGPLGSGRTPDWHAPTGRGRAVCPVLW